MTQLILHQFASSHFNEKARWALDFKNIPHQRISYLPGPHMGKIKKLTAGTGTSTPVLEAETVIQGSARIIDYLELLQSDPALYPTDGDNKSSALAWQSRMDSELGPAVRTVAFSIFVNEPGFLAKTFSIGKSLPVKTAYRAVIPLLTPVISKANGANSIENIERCAECVDQYLTEISKSVQATGYLVGNSFSVADLTAAALLAPLAQLQHPDMRRPSPIPATMQALTNAYAAHPAIDWVHRIYAEHRPTRTSSGVT
tara:strand:+ start:13863 stop:14633 length:771 start_codon:yes stop_codon:yes gene_type:complete